MEGKFNTNFELMDDSGNVARLFDITVCLTGDDATLDYFVGSLRSVAYASADLINDMKSKGD
ncbi:MAG: hypothetical protein GX272_12990 [Epulopiscium sp.]|nr:hypothetical protein [Candidatus Epulonipiscium sp.]